MTDESPVAQPTADQAFAHVPIQGPEKTPTQDADGLPGTSNSTAPLAVAKSPTVSPHIPVTRLTPLFKLVFLTIAGITVLAFVVNTMLVLVMKTPNDQAKLFFETCSTIVKMGFGAIIGLIGGKAA